MKYFFKQLKRMRDGLSLSEQSKSEMRARLVSHMRATRAVRESEAERHKMVKGSTIFTKEKIGMKFASFLALLAVLLGGGTSLAAQAALPGDALYPVKTNFNEKVEAAVRFSVESDTRLAAQIAERRLMEAESLATEGRLSAEAEADLASSFEEAIDKTESGLMNLRSSGKASVAARINSELEASLSAYARSFAAIDDDMETDVEGESDSNIGAGLVLPALRAALESSESARVEFEKEVVGEGSAESDSETDARLRLVVEERIEATERFIASLRSEFDGRRNNLTPEVRMEIAQQIESVYKIHLKSKALLEDGEYAEALELSGSAMRQALELKIILNLHAGASGGLDATVINDAQTDLGVELESETRKEIDPGFGGGSDLKVGPLDLGF